MRPNPFGFPEDMVESPIKHKNPVIGLLDRPYRETGTRGFALYLWRDFCVSARHALLAKPYQAHMNNDLQKAVITALTIFSLSVGYYFVWHLPKQEKREVAEQERKEEIANMQKCEQIGSERYKEDNKGSGGYLMSPEYKFDKETNRCLYKGGIISSDGYVTKYIYDLYTNKEIVSYTANQKGEVLIGSQEEYGYQEYLLFQNK